MKDEFIEFLDKHSVSHDEAIKIIEGLKLKDFISKKEYKDDASKEIIYDIINKPHHYNWIPKIECKDVIFYFPSLLGMAIGYIWRCRFKGKPVEDLEKAIKCLQFEVENLKSGKLNFFYDSENLKVEK